MAEAGKPILIPFGEWPYDASSRQRLDRTHAEAIANELNEAIANGEPGIPVYQGHPDVPELAPKYPDKGALGWVVKAELANEGIALTVEWDRDPGNGFKWFSPYWLANDKDGDTFVVCAISSIGLTNKPNIPDFRLPNEEKTTKEKPEMDKEKLIAALGLPETASEEDILAAIAANKAEAEKAAAAAQKAEAAETALANEKAAHERTRLLKTQSATAALANEKTPEKRIALVNELQRTKSLSFDQAWFEAKRLKPELF